MILIVDDDDTTRFLIKKVIEKVDQQKRILTATNGKEALSVLHQTCSVNNCPLLILLDIHMPVMNGFEFLQELQNSSWATLPIQIVVLTTSNNPIDHLLASDYPVIAFLEKPLTEDKLKRVMED